MFSFKKAFAETLFERGNVSNGYFSRQAIEERGGGFQEFKELFVNIDELSEKLLSILDWINNLPVSLPKLTADLLTNIYHLLSKIALQTPLFIFNNPFLKNASLTFAILSITIVTLLTIFEAIMQMCKQDHTDFKTIMKRYSIIAALSGFLPFAFETGFSYINDLSQAISHIGSVNGGSANGFIMAKKMGFWDTFIITLFDLTAISMLIPFALQAGRRWFDLMSLACIAPLALSSWVFDRHRHYFRKWWSHVKSLSIVQLVYAIFILLMGIFIFSTQSIQGGILTILFKLLIVCGGLWRMVNPPRFVTTLADGSGSDIFDMYDNQKKSFKNVVDTLTLKNFRPMNFLKKQKEGKLNQLNKIKQLQKKHGKRYVGDLL